MTMNETRRERGFQLVAAHPDYTEMEFEHAASDTIADILHAVFDGTYVAPSGEFYADGYRIGTPQDLLNRALDCYLGDAEDDEAGR